MVLITDAGNTMGRTYKHWGSLKENMIDKGKYFALDIWEDRYIVLLKNANNAIDWTCEK